MPEQKIKVTVDAVIFRRMASSDKPEVLLIRRENDPFRNQWAFPGGFLEEDEDLKEGAARELEEETGLKNIPLHQTGAFGKPGRDPRGPTVTIAFTGWCTGECLPVGSSDAAEARWFSIESLPELAFDHSEILKNTMDSPAFDQKQ